jgi:hypothetical protein
MRQQRVEARRVGPPRSGDDRHFILRFEGLQASSVRAARHGCIVGRVNDEAPAAAILEEAVHGAREHGSLAPIADELAYELEPIVDREGFVGVGFGEWRAAHECSRPAADGLNRPWAGGHLLNVDVGSQVFSHPMPPWDPW